MWHVTRSVTDQHGFSPVTEMIERYLVIAATQLGNLGQDSGSGGVSSKGGVSHGSGGSNIGGVGDGRGGGDSDNSLSDGVDRGVNSLGHGLDGVGPGLMHNGLSDGLVGPDGAVDGLGAEGGDVLENGLGHVGGPDNWGGLVGGDRGGDVGVGGLGHGGGEGGNLGDHLSEGVSLGGRVGKVATKSENTKKFYFPIFVPLAEIVLNKNAEFNRKKF